MCKLQLLTVLGWLAWSQAAAAASEESLRLVPFPKEVRRLAGEFSLRGPLVLEAPPAQRAVLLGLLNEELRRAGLPPAEGRGSPNDSPNFRLAPASGEAAGPPPAQPREKAPEAYALEVRGGEVVGIARAAAGLFYSVQTLCQLIRANRSGEALPQVAIQDWPSLRWRAFQDDMTRGPSSQLDTLKYEVALASYLKLNLMTYYMEYQFAFKKHPAIGPTNGSLEAPDLAALVDFAKPLQVDILGNQQSFGHFSQILKHPEYARLRETGDVLTPVREETYQLLDDLYAEVCPVLPFPWFNVCCDETYGLGEGPARELAARLGLGGVYVQHIRRVHDLLRDKHKKRMMMWGDIILQHPGNLQQIPKDTIMLTWGYDPRPSFEDQIVPFARSGYEFFVCPGVNNWSRILPDFGAAITNIHNFVRDGIKHGALGMINTDWEDDGEAINAVKWHLDAWAAECAWNASATSIEAFNRRLGAVLFGEAGDHFGQAVGWLTRTHRLPGMNGMFNSRFWEPDFAPKAAPVAVQATATNLLAVVRPAIQHLETCRREARCNQPLLEALLFGARRMELIGQRMLDGLRAAQLYEQAGESPARPELLAQVEQLARKNRDAHEQAGRQFARLWLAESKPYALDWTLRRYTNTVAGYDALLGRLAAARALPAGQPLPAAEEVGLAIPKPMSRLLRPRPAKDTPLLPEQPWTDPAATHRMGLVVQAGDRDRFDLPVELDLELPAGLARLPVRAFQLDGQGSQREVPAQLEAGGQPGRGRLVLALPGRLPKGAEASVLVYAGLEREPSTPAGAASASAGSLGGAWLENGHVRLLVGAEGAHVYRWELKALSHRDLTMPGEAGWAGFSDIGSQRQAPYRVVITARGPAMAECQCTGPAGQVKTIRLYPGGSWIEVLLSEPTPLYWDFDDPKNFAADGPAPGAWLFSNGQTGKLGREADGVPAQVKAANVFWGLKHNPDRLALGLVTPETRAFHHLAPGAGAGGAGIESSPPAGHFITFAGVLEQSPAETMNRLQATLDLKRPVGVRIGALQNRP